MFFEGVGRTLLSQETTMELDILRIGSVEASSVSGEKDSGTRMSYLFNGFGLLKG